MERGEGGAQWQQHLGEDLWELESYIRRRVVRIATVEDELLELQLLLGEEFLEL